MKFGKIFKKINSESSEMVEVKKKLNLLLRGHVRDSLSNKDLFIFIKKLSEICDLTIFIHTWNVVQNSISWRNLESVDQVVSEDYIRDYFEDLNPLIKNIIIDDDSKIELKGILDGNVAQTPCPIRGYKNMYYGKLRLAECVYDSVPANQVCVQTRFDILSNPFSRSQEDLLKFIYINLHNVKTGATKERIKFIDDFTSLGIDNIYIGTAENMYMFVNHMYENMDTILVRHRDTHHQEFLSFFERNNFHKEKSIAKTIICDLEGTLIEYSDPKESGKSGYSMNVLNGSAERLGRWSQEGNQIIIMTERKENLRTETEKQLKEAGLIYDLLIMGINAGEKIVISDTDNVDNFVSVINTEKNMGICAL